MIQALGAASRKTAIRGSPGVGGSLYKPSYSTRSWLAAAMSSENSPPLEIPRPPIRPSPSRSRMLSVPRRCLVLARPQVPALAVIFAIEVVGPALALWRLPDRCFHAVRGGIIKRARRISSTNSASRRSGAMFVRAGTCSAGWRLGSPRLDMGVSCGGGCRKRIRAGLSGRRSRASLGDIVD